MCGASVVAVVQVAAKTARLEALRSAGRTTSPEAKTKILAKFKKFRVCAVAPVAVLCLSTRTCAHR